MTPGQKPASLADVLPYTPDTEFSEDEVSLMRSVFGGVMGPKVMKVLRKALLPTISDPELPLEKLSQDAFMGGLEFKSMSVDELKAIVMGRQEAIKFVMGGLVRLKVLASAQEETPQNRAARRAADSAK